MVKSVLDRVARLAFVLSIALAGRANAQMFDLPAAPPGYTSFVPDISDSTYNSTSIRDRWFTLKFGAVPIVDYTWFAQDQASLDQVGEQEDAWDIRSARILARGELFRNHAKPWTYLVSFEYRGFDTDPDNDWSFTDISITAPVGGLGKLTVGKTKESTIYEMVGDAANLPHMERLLSPFFVSRNIGLRFNHVMADERGTWALGAYNDWFTKDLSYEDSGWDLSGRVTSLPVWSETGRRFLHLGASWRYAAADDGVLRYRGRPESNVADYYVDTKAIPAENANTFAAEALWNAGPFSLLGELTTTHVNVVGDDEPNFHGYYLTGSWVVTGEHRPYDKKVGYARRVMPNGHWGALELFGRYGVVDVTDQGIDGGEMKAWSAGANWWATRRWRVTVGYGEETLDKGGTEGRTEQLHTRLQWVY